VRKTIGVRIFCALAVAASVAAPGSTAGASTKFDGLWSLVVYTTSGQCEPSYRFSGQIRNGEISYANNSLDVTGEVVESGAVFVKVVSRSGHAEAHGQFTTTRGSGTWSGESADGRCSGTWTATRPDNG
jgi:hypothetical protein